MLDDVFRQYEARFYVLLFDMCHKFLCKDTPTVKTKNKSKGSPCQILCKSRFVVKVTILCKGKGICNGYYAFSLWISSGFESIQLLADPSNCDAYAGVLLKMNFSPMAQFTYYYHISPICSDVQMLAVWDRPQPWYSKVNNSLVAIIWNGGQ